MALASLDNRRFKLGGKSYFVAGAHECQIGSIGEKRSPLGKPKYLDVKAHVGADKIGTVGSDVVDVTLDVGNVSGLRALFPIQVTAGGITLPMPVDLGRLSREVLEGKLKLVHLWATDQRLENAINESPRRRDDLIRWGNDARIVSQVFVVVEATLAEKFRSQTSVSIGKSIEGLIGAEVGGDGGRAGRVDVTLSRGAVFAYQLGKLEWDAKAKKKRQLVVDIDDDQFGTG